MTEGIRPLRPEELTDALVGATLPGLAERLKTRGAGHCMRVADLDVPVMVRLCERLRAAAPEAAVVVVSDGHPEVPSHVAATSARLVELRNPLDDGALRPPLLAFVPDGARVAAEDSFGVATFEDVPVDGAYERLRRALVEALPAGLRNAVEQCLQALTTPPYAPAGPLAVVRFLLTASVQGNDAGALGASLYELGLVPDFEWLTRPEHALRRLERNRRCVEALTHSPRTERARVQTLGLSDRAFRKELADFLVDAGLEDPRAWTRSIALDRARWGFSFHRWAFDDAGEPDAVCISEVETDLPRVPDSDPTPALRAIAGQQYLAPGAKGLRRFSVKFKVAPTPARVPAVSRFVVQIISKDRGPVGISRAKAAWRDAKDHATVTFTGLRLDDWEDGWHYARVLALSTDGESVPLLDLRGNPVPRGNDAALGGSRPHESDLFYVYAGGDVEVEPVQRAAPRAPSLAHARLERRFAAAIGGRDPSAVAVTEVAWVRKEGPSAAGTVETLVVKMGREGTVHVPLSRALIDLERAILRSPRGPLSWELTIQGDAVGSPSPATGPWPASAATERFLAARERWFLAVRGEGDLVVEATEPSRAAAEATEYAAAWQALLSSLVASSSSSHPTERRDATLGLRRLLSLDTARVSLVDHRGQRREAVLLSPTHPLRALWVTAWERLGEQWIDDSTRAPVEFCGPARDALLETLMPVDAPPVLLTASNQCLTAVDNLGPFWTLYVSPSEHDPRGLFGAVCDALGLRGPAAGPTPQGEQLAARVRRYLLQHPYVRTLRVNAFNAGRAKLLADALVTLQADPALADLRYDIKLFVPDPDAPNVAQTLLDLGTPDADERATDAFAQPCPRPLHSKLRVAVLATVEFRAAPARHDAHLSFLFDLFPAQEIGATVVTDDAPSPLHGLAQDFAVTYREDDLSAVWERRPVHGEATPIPGAEVLTRALTRAAAATSEAVAALAASRFVPGVRPVVRLVLGAEERALLHHVHEGSDWVFTLDRNLGIEFFDHGDRRRPDYLIDHDGDLGHTFGRRLVITSRSITELEALLGPALVRYGLGAEEGHAAALLRQLRALSGRLALKLISAPTQQAEAIGLALARLYLEAAGGFGAQAVVPLDAHLDLYRALKRSAEASGDEVSFRRTDLALFDLDAARRTVTCRLVEVKCYQDAGDEEDYAALRRHVASQIEQSERVIAWHFAPQDGRPDRALKAREFARLVAFYLERSRRHNVIQEPAVREAHALLATLDEGYSLEFTRSALVFDFSRAESSPTEHEHGVEFHRVGHATARRLVEAEAARLREGTADGASTPAVEVEPGPAAFLPPAREYRVPSREPSIEPPTPDAPAAPPPMEGPPWDVMLGAAHASTQYGILGESSGRRVAVDLNDPHTICLFGVQGAGKSYTLGTLVEMACAPAPAINRLPVPLATVIFHYSAAMDYAPEFVSLRAPNDDVAQLEELRRRYGAEARGLDDVALLVPANKVDARRKEYPGVAVHPLAFAPGELQAGHWRMLMGAVGNPSAYLTQLRNLFRRIPAERLTVDLLRAQVDGLSMPDRLKELARMRLDLAAEYIAEGPGIASLVRPGRVLIVDLRDEFIEKDEAFSLFFVLLQIVASAGDEESRCNKLFVFDEAHKYLESPALVEELIRFVREMRHLAFSVLIASQDPPSVSDKLISLSDLLILHRFNAPRWLKHIQDAAPAFKSMTAERMAALQPGEAFVWASNASDPQFAREARKVQCRPRITRHGGVTRSATGKR